MPRGRTSSESSLESYRNHLLQQRAHIDAQLLAVEQIMGGMNGLRQRPSIGAPRRDARLPNRSISETVRPGSLREFITKVMRGGDVMRVSEIAGAVRRGGYKTKKMGRGQFRMS